MTCTSFVTIKATEFPVINSKQISSPTVFLCAQVSLSPFAPAGSIGPQRHSSNELGSQRSSSAEPMSIRLPSFQPPCTSSFVLSR
ncbi:hypothetical protein XELAEV_18040505mg [Xenopus laevis]|uniref:Uncharacterized protein n=1 Tax=Xenopus laevis TaxID=8355 RepID=A0A974CAS4_XENLA|nr:hypothetical protein XELAEV_18040505mg [Xenopus laevis]